jgi:hypothetical protein
LKLAEFFCRKCLVGGSKILSTSFFQKKNPKNQPPTTQAWRKVSVGEKEEKEKKMPLIVDT